MRSLVLATATVALLAHITPLAAGDPPREAAPKTPSVAPITSLAFLEGTWVGSMEGERFEASYSSPSGGKIVSWSKGFSGQRATFVELEVFEEKAGELVLTPSPDGRRAPSFVLEKLEGERAVFVGKQAFPREIVYERLSVDRLRFVVSGEQRGEHVEWVLELRRARQSG